MAIRKSYRKQILARMKTKRDQALVIVGRQAIGFVKPLVPVDSGFLRSSITFATTMKSSAKPRVPAKAKRAGITEAAEKIGSPEEIGHVVIGTNVHYAPHIEYGTVKTSAQPFLRPGILNNKQELANTFAKAMKGI